MKNKKYYIVVSQANLDKMLKVLLQAAVVLFVANAIIKW